MGELTIWFGEIKFSPSFLLMDSISKADREMNSISIPEGDSVLRYSITDLSLSSPLSRDFSFLFSNSYSGCFDFGLSSVNKVAFSKLFGAKFDDSKVVALSRSKRKNGDFGRSFFGRVGLFLSFICSRLKMACHLL
jgi:hypothetical protein